MNSVIATLEAHPPAQLASVQPEVARLIYWLLRNNNVQRAVETGSFIGYSTLHIAQAIHDNGGGHLDAIDLFLPLDYQSPLCDAPCSSHEMVARHLHAAALGSIVTLHQGDSSEILKQLKAQPVPPYDFAFIDGDHRIQGVLRDFALMDSMLVEGGLLLLHDTSIKDSGWVGPRFLINKLQETGLPAHYSVVELFSSDRFGLALLQKKSPHPTRTWRPSIADLIFEKINNKLIGWKK